MQVKPNPQSPDSKKQQVEAMFNSIADKYDFLNRFLSLGIDKGWRKKAIRYLEPMKPKHILDVATGTADLAIEASKLNPEKIIGIDIAQQMLDVGSEKIKKLGLSNIITLTKGDSENLPFNENSFDAVTVAFGVRNFENLETGLKEIYRVLKPNGRVVILEFSNPQVFPYKQLYNFYFKNILPFWGNLLSKSGNAYTYLPQSVKHFPEGKAFGEILNQCNFEKIIIKPLTFGTCTLYVANK
ncbi:MAG: bifunctional demethylmenaquinone methyltransferase/2-methoxy-6-polyprenyl-1,4-benzoquinol methylase UbiE [Bacteroidia bacterium]